jgi:hypothetical protein
LVYELRVAKTRVACLEEKLATMEMRETSQRPVNVTV